MGCVLSSESKSDFLITMSIFGMLVLALFIVFCVITTGRYYLAEERYEHPQQYTTKPYCERSVCWECNAKLIVKEKTPKVKFNPNQDDIIFEKE